MGTIRPTPHCGTGTSGSGTAQPVSISGPASPFGEILISDLNPSFQIDFIDSLVNISTVNTYNIGAGSGITTDENDVVVSSGTDANGFARVMSKRVVSYQPGQGTVLRFTARYTTPDPNVNQLAGLYNGVSAYKFGYNGETFGILYRRKAVREIRALTITVGSSSVANATITLDGETKLIPLTGGGSTTKTAYELSKTSFYNIADGWKTNVVGNVVYFIALNPKAYSGTFSFSHGTAVGSFSTIASGESPTETFISQEDWNLDKMDGTGDSRMKFNPLNSNVYEIKYQYLGYGDAIFGIENNSSSNFIPVHIIKNAGNTDYPVIRNPIFFMDWSVENTGITATGCSLYGASAGGFIAGVKKYLGPKFAYSNTKTYSSTGLIPVFSIKSGQVFNGLASTTPIRFLRISIGCDITKPAEILIYSNPVLDTANFTAYNSSASRAEIDTTATSATVSGASCRLIAAYSIGKSTETTIDISSEDFDLQIGDIFTFCINSHNGSANQDISISVSWVEG